MKQKYFSPLGDGGMGDELYNQGMQTRRSVLGDEHVDNAENNKTGFDKFNNQFT